MFYEFEGGWLNTSMIITMYAGICDDGDKGVINYAIYMQTPYGVTKAKARFTSEAEAKKEMDKLMSDINKTMGRNDA